MRYPDYPIPAEEVMRQRALERYGVLDTQGDEHFDRLVRLASRLLHAPTALISLVDADRQWFLARHGLDVQETPRHMAFCAHAIAAKDPLVVPDAQMDERFRTNPLVAGEPFIRFYASAPLNSPEGQRLGTLCVLDRLPRHLTAVQAEVLEDLAQLVMRELELRRQFSLCPETGVLQRSHFLAMAQREVERSRQLNAPLALLVIQLDGDGSQRRHRLGDPAHGGLKAVAQFCASVVRSADMIGRVGDSELAVLLVNVGEEEAMELAEVIRQGISDLGVKVQGGAHPVDFRDGLTMLGQGDVSLEALLRSAERSRALLYGRDEARGAPSAPSQPQP